MFRPRGIASKKGSESIPLMGRPPRASSSSGAPRTSTFTPFWFSFLLHRIFTQQPPFIPVLCCCCCRQRVGEYVCCNMDVWFVSTNLPPAGLQPADTNNKQSFASFVFSLRAPCASPSDLFRLLLLPHGPSSWEMRRVHDVHDDGVQITRFNQASPDPFLGCAASLLWCGKVSLFVFSAIGLRCAAAVLLTHNWNV